MKMKFEDIYQFFQDPPPNYLNKELAVCYALSVLIEGESYGTYLIQQLEHEYPTYRLLDTVLYSALKFLEEAGAITGYWKKVEGRGRPRRMYQISSEWWDKAKELAGFWQSYRDRPNHEDYQLTIKQLIKDKLMMRARIRELEQRELTPQKCDRILNYIGLRRGNIHYLMLERELIKAFGGDWRNRI